MSINTYQSSLRLVMGEDDFTCSNTACLGSFFTEIGMEYNFPDTERNFSLPTVEKDYSLYRH